MRDFFKVSSVISFIGALGFLFVVFEGGKPVFLASAVLMLFNGVNYWIKGEEKDAAIKEHVENR